MLFAAQKYDISDYVVKINYFSKKREEMSKTTKNIETKRSIRQAVEEKPAFTERKSFR